MTVFTFEFDTFALKPPDNSTFDLRYVAKRAYGMDPENLKTASAYINNLLLARGLLRNGDPIEFARPHKTKGGMEASMGQVINLVHDLVLRRDVRF